MALSLPLMFGAFQGFFLALVLSFKKETRIHTILIALLFFSSLFLMYEYFVFNRYLIRYPHLIGITLPLLYSIPPLFYFFIREVNGSENSKPRFMLHLVPSMLVLLIMTPYFASSSQHKLMLLFAHESASELYPFRDYLGLGLWASAVIYGLLSYRTSITTCKKGWVQSLTKFNLILILAISLAWVFIILDEHTHREVMIIAALLFSLLIHFIGYTAFRGSTFLPVQTKASNKLFTLEERETIKAGICRLLEEDKVYKNSSFSISELGKILQTNTKYLSTIINKEFGCSFTFLVNTHRIKEAEKMILDNQFSHLSFLGIAVEVGFTNKNSFTRAFKRHRGITPSQFKQANS